MTWPAWIDANRAPSAELDSTEHTSDEITRLAVLATLFLAGLHLEFAGGVSAALLITVATVPMWWGAIGRVEFARLLLGLSALALVVGMFLAQSAAVDHVISRAGQRQYIVLLLSGLAVMVTVLWGRAHLPLHLVAVAYGLGDLTDALLFTSRSWKYFLALPATVIVVGWLGRYARKSPAVIALLVLGVLTALDRGRSFFAFCVLAACVVVWQSLPSSSSARARRWTPAILLAVAGAVLYNLAIRLLASGYLGEAAQERTVEQIETSGSLILGGRPQWAAMRALVADRPWGYGLGVVPNSHDYALVTAGFQSINLDEDGYIRHSMLFGQFRMHSITSDLWVRCGVVGVLVALVMGFAIVRTLSGLIAQRRCPPVVALMSILAMWYLVFEPTFSYSRDVFFALGILLQPRRRGSPELETSPAG